MIRNYLKVAIRYFIRNKIFSVINIFGLGAGLTCSLLILLWVKDERSIDGFHSNGQHLYSIYEKQISGDKVEAFHSTPGLMAEELRQKFPEVKLASGYSWEEQGNLEAGEKGFKAKGHYVSNDFLRMFSYPLVAGNKENALQSVGDISISHSLANRLFGSPETALGKLVYFKDTLSYKVSSVFENIPVNSSQQFDFLLSWDRFLQENQWLKDWGTSINEGPRTYVVLDKTVDAGAFEKKIRHFMDSYFKEQQSNFRIELGIQRFDDIYLHSQFSNGVISGGRIEYVRIFSLIAIFILVIACINFINLTIARSAKRAKEIGIRKASGAVRIHLVGQFLSEAVLLVLISMILAVGISYLLLPAFNELTSKQILIPWFNGSFWTMILAVSIFTGVLAGSYPAFLLSSLKPIWVLKGKRKTESGGNFFRKALVVFQFVISIGFIFGTIVINSQLRYLQDKKPGYDRAHLIYVPLEGNLINKFELFKQELEVKPGIDGITRITQEPSSVTSGTYDLDWEGKDPNAKAMFTWANVGYDFAKIMNLQWLQGRDFSKDYPTDSTAVVLNESALKTIGYENPIGKKITFWGESVTIIGVVKDFHFSSLHEPIHPLILRLNENENRGFALISIKPGKANQAILSLQNITTNLNPKYSFNWIFADEAYQKLYRAEEITNKLSNYFAFLAILISCIGLLGLAIYAADKRTREFGIRKVLGASSSSLFFLLSKEFMALVLIAYIMASPLAWLIMNKWLLSFAYKIHINAWMFLLGGLIAIAITLLTISYQALLAAITNPVKALRSE